MYLLAEPVVAGVVAVGGALVALAGWRTCLWWRELERELQALAERERVGRAVAPTWSSRWSSRRDDAAMHVRVAHLRASVARLRRENQALRRVPSSGVWRVGRRCRPARTTVARRADAFQWSTTASPTAQDN